MPQASVRASNTSLTDLQAGTFTASPGWEQLTLKNLNVQVTNTLQQLQAQRELQSQIALQKKTGMMPGKLGNPAPFHDPKITREVNIDNIQHFLAHPEQTNPLLAAIIPFLKLIGFDFTDTGNIILGRSEANRLTFTLDGRVLWRNLELQAPEQVSTALTLCLEHMMGELENSINHQDFEEVRKKNISAGGGGVVVSHKEAELKDPITGTVYVTSMDQSGTLMVKEAEKIKTSLTTNL